MINVREKGKAGVLEFCHRFNPFFPNGELKRNLLQTREGGADVVGCEPFQIEVKRCQKIEQRKWWRQVKAATNEGEVPTVAYRANKQPWRFLLPSELLGIRDEGFVEVSEEVWLKFVIQVFDKIPPF